MDSLIYSLNATLPVFLTMFIGYILKKIGMLNKGFADAAEKFNFKITLPALLFAELSSTDIRGMFEWKYVVFCAVITCIIFFVIWVFAKIFIKDRSVIGAFVQASYRSSAAVMGVAFIQNIYGTAGMAPMMIIGCVPLFNVFAVLVLTVEGNSDESGRKMKNALINVAKNPIIIGIVLGIFVSIFQIKFPHIIDKTIKNFSSMATPLALIVIGVGFEGKKALSKIKLTMAASVIKLIALPGIFMTVAIFMGFHDQELVALIIMLGSPTTPTSYIMAKNMNSDGDFSASTILMTTLLSSVTLTLWIFVARCLGYIA